MPAAPVTRARVARPWTLPQYTELPKDERDIVLDRLQKEVALVPTTRRYSVRGVNHVARAIAKRDVAVVVFAADPESRAFGHVPLLCRLHDVPVCVLHASSQTLGRLFGLSRLAAVALRRAPETSAATDPQMDAAARAREIERLESITAFLVAKASTRVSTCSCPRGPVRRIALLRKVLVVIGTTGAGKTKLSVDLAKAVGGEIVNSDAMQMYRGLDVATAKITEQEKQGIPHHLFDVVDPSSRCDVLEFKRLALRAIDDVLARGRVPIVVGGTMYYTQSILWKSQLLDDVPLKASVAPQLQKQRQWTPDALYARLQAVDPVMAARLHVNNVRKVERSLQVFEQTGVPHSELLARQERDARNVEKYFDACAFWVHASKPVLSERLVKRVDTMLSSGLLEEIRGLRAQLKEHPPRLHPDIDTEEAQNSVGISQAIGYKEFQPYFDALEAAAGKPDDPQALETILDSCIEQLNIGTRQYARRQLSWIRNKFVTKNIPVYQLDSSDVTKWATLVADPAIEIARKFVKGEAISSHQTVQQQQPEAAKTVSLEDKFEKNSCAVCHGREFTGKKQWAEHLRSKGHKFHLKRIKLQKEQEEREVLLGKKRCEEEKDELDLQPQTDTES
ncbi:unnamed protein product [Hyaloperonospora brassicae]|uniref:Ribosomal protein eL8/eL30/eS12/Gadd45 domain-containing protein n=1 Tax=Hyaloperonospora brassicae TaxID=162125 RepID=A0AAV0T9X5_HYABA|nr:unnamed protein product [Hyaloperonospora brassicae]